MHPKDFNDVIVAPKRSTSKPYLGVQFTPGYQSNKYERSCPRHGKLADHVTSTSPSANQVLSFTNTHALCEDLQKLLDIPEICDIKFLVGPSRTPVYGVKAILATRNRSFFSMILEKQRCDVHEYSRRGSPKKTSLLSKLKNRFMGKISDRHLVLEIPDFDPVSFRKVIVYLQTGDITLDMENLIGVVNVADKYGLEELRQACHRFTLKSLTVSNAYILLRTAMPYINAKWTKLILTEVLDFISQDSGEFLNRKEFETLPLDIVSMVLAHEGLKISDEHVWDAAYHWMKRQPGIKSDPKLMKSSMQRLVKNIDVKNIPIKKLLREVKPLEIVTNDVIKELIAHWSSSKISLLHQIVPSCNQERPSVPVSVLIQDGRKHTPNGLICLAEANAVFKAPMASPERWSLGSEFQVNSDYCMLI